ncbi:unnamed protein product [Calypogeia fissa]
MMEAVAGISRSSAAVTSLSGNAAVGRRVAVDAPRTISFGLHSGGLSEGCSFGRLLGFKKGFVGLGQQQRRWEQCGDRNHSSNGERPRMQKIAATSSGKNFLGRAEEALDPESQPVSLPVIGQIPFTRKELSMFTPMKFVVWIFLGTLVYTVWNLITSVSIFNPTFLMYSTWIFVKWPWPAAISVGIATLVTAYRSSKRQPKEWEQVLLLLGSLTWLILVPHGLFSGFVDGWPLVLYLLYCGFFLISAVVRYRLYGDLSNKDEDKQWETLPSRLWQIGFVICVVLGHWLAAFEAPFLPQTWTFEWKTLVAMVSLALSVVTHYTATYFLGKYFNRLVRPAAVVMFGPYRFVRHPIYSSYMLLFGGYCLALRSYMSLLFLMTACILYYEQRTKLEEDMLADFFGVLYESYREKVKQKYFPLIY